MCIQSASYITLLHFKKCCSAKSYSLPLVIEFTNWHANNKQSLHAFSVLFTFENEQKSTKYKHVTLKLLWVALYFKYIFQLLTILCTCQYCIKDSFMLHDSISINENIIAILKVLQQCKNNSQWTLIKVTNILSKWDLNNMQTFTNWM